MKQIKKYVQKLYFCWKYFVYFWDLTANGALTLFAEFHFLTKYSTVSIMFWTICLLNK